MITIRAHYDGKVIVPDESVDLQPDRPLIVHLEDAPTPKQDEDAWSFLAKRTGTVDAPEDWSAEHDHYLYGTRKRSA